MKRWTKDDYHLYIQEWSDGVYYCVSFAMNETKYEKEESLSSVSACFDAAKTFVESVVMNEQT